MDLSKPLQTLLEPLFSALPLDAAMPHLVVTQPSKAEHVALAAEIVEDPLISANAPLVSYVDDLDRSHTHSQQIKTEIGSFWHGIMHRREGDFWNSHYWFNRVGTHAAMRDIEGYDPHRLIDQVEAAQGSEDSGLVQMQRNEWAALFSWCSRYPRTGAA